MELYIIFIMRAVHFQIYTLLRYVFLGYVSCLPELSKSWG